MADSSVNLSIILKLIDEASSALQGVSSKTKASLEDIQTKANEVRNSFGLLGGAITAGLGLLVKQAADTATADMQLTSAVKAGIAAADEDTSSTSILAKQKALLQSQLELLTGKIGEYQTKINAGKDANGTMTSSIDLLQQKASALRDKLETLNNEQQLAGQSTETLVSTFEKAAKANTSLGFANDETVKSLTTLFRATGSVTETLSANQEAMDLARAKNIDLSTAATLVIQAMEGNGRALKQFGINLKDGLTPAEALAELQQKLAGSARDYVNTPWGQLDVAKAKTQLLAETLGTQLLPILNRFLEAIIPVITKITEWTEAHPTLTKYILLAVAAVGLLALGISAIAAIISASISVFLGLSTAVSVLGVALTFLAANPIGLIILAIGAVIVAGVLLYNHWDVVKAKLRELGDWFKSIWAEIESIVKSAVDYVMGLLQPLINTINAVKNAAASIGGAVGGAISNAGSLLVHAVTPHADGGIVLSPHIGLVGEAGPEAIIPLSRAGNFGLGNAITVNITGNNISSSLDVRGIADAVSEEIVRVLRLNQKLAI
jgi:hypothetical protein